MRKKLIAAMFLTACLFMTACGKADQPGSAVGTEGGGGNVSQPGSAEADGTVKLGEYKNLKVNKSIVVISDSDVEDEINNMLQENPETELVDRAAAEGDYIDFFFTAKAGDETILDYSEELYSTTIGDEEFGAEFDAKMIGLKAGDHTSFSVTYDGSADEEYAEDSFTGKTVSFDVTIEGVYELVAPELTDEYVQEAFEYESVDELRENIKQQLQEAADDDARTEMEGDLLLQVIENSEIYEYDQDFYDQIAKQVVEQYTAYVDFFGLESVDEVYEMFDLTSVDIENEIIYYVQERLVVNEIAKQENITVSDEEYQQVLTSYAMADEAEDIDEYEKEFGPDNIRFLIIESKVINLLVENAQITEVTKSL